MVRLMRRLLPNDDDLKEKIHARLLGKCEVDRFTGCHIFTGAWEPDGMGKVRVGRKSYTVSRVAAWLYMGLEDLDGPEMVYHNHLCRTPACFNPEHLAIAGNRNEAFDVLRSMGRWASGKGRKLNRAKASYMRLQATTMSRTAIGEYHRVTQWAVRRVLNNETYVMGDDNGRHR